MRSLLLVYSTGMKSLLSPWLQNIYFSPFLWILVPFWWIPVDSAGMAPFLQESVGQGEVLQTTTSQHRRQRRGGEVVATAVEAAHHGGAILCIQVRLQAVEGREEDVRMVT